MSRLIRPFLGACAVAALAGCGGTDESEPPAEAAQRRVIGDPLHQALDRAGSVQETVDARAAELRERLEAGEQD